MVIIQKFSAIQKSRHKLTLRFCHEKLLKVAQENKKDRHPIHTWANWRVYPPVYRILDNDLGWALDVFHCTDLHFQMSNILEKLQYILTNIIRRINIENIAILFEQRNPPKQPGHPNGPQHPQIVGSQARSPMA